MITYTAHEMVIVTFDDGDVFADLEFASEGTEGELEESYKPGYSDK